MRRSERRAFARGFGGLLIAAFAFPSMAGAEEGRRQLELGLYGGAFIPSKDHELYDSNSTRQSPFSTLGLDLALRAGYFPLSFVGAEVEGGFMPQTSLGTRTSIFTARGHVVLQLPTVVSPFVVAGGGVLAVTSPNGKDVDRALHFGVGMKVHATDWLSFRVDGRQIISAGRGAGAGNTSHFELLGGISIGLWAERPELPRASFDFVEVEVPRPQAVPAATSWRLAPAPTPEVFLAEALDGVYFRWGSAELAPHNYPALDRALSVLLAHPNIRVRIVGHTDATGPDAFNLKLSQERATSVTEYLVDHGVAAERIDRFGFGEQMPVASNRTRKGRALNRRSEVRVLDEAGNGIARAIELPVFSGERPRRGSSSR